MRTTTKEKVEHSFSKHHYTCDRCGDPCGPDEKTTSSYQVCKVEIEMKDGVKIDMSINPPVGFNVTNIKNVKFEFEEGDEYPEGGDIEVTVIDCCSRCFKEVVLPKMIEVGFKPRIEDRNW